MSYFCNVPSSTLNIFHNFFGQFADENGIKWFNLHFSDYLCTWTVFTVYYCISLSIARHVLCVFLSVHSFLLLIIYTLYILRLINLCLWIPSLVLYLFHFKTVIFAFYISYFFTFFYISLFNSQWPYFCYIV